MTNDSRSPRSRHGRKTLFDPARLFGSITVREFRRKYWPERAWVGPRLLRRLDLLEEVPALHGLETLLDTRGIFLSAVSPQYRTDQVQDRGLTATKAKRLYASGCTLTIGGLHEVVPQLGRL